MKHTNVQRLLITACFLLIGTFMVQAQEQGYPTNPEFGKCYAKCVVPDEYETVTEQILVKPESKRIITIPAQYETKTEQILIKEASTKIVPIPAVYETVTETIEVKPAATKLVEVPATFETVTERILTAPESGKWESKNIYGSGSSSSTGGNSQYRGQVSTACLQGKGDPGDCNILCWVKIPAQYKTVTKKVEKTPATTNTIEIPAEYQTITRQVVKSPATTQTVEIPAEYRTITKRLLVSPAQTQEEVIPAEYSTVTKTQLVKKDGFTTSGAGNNWEEVVCDTKIDGNLIRNVQQALKNAGYYNGAIDGIQGGGTNSALKKYQQDNGLPVGNMNIKTLKALGVY